MLHLAPHLPFNWIKSPSPPTPPPQSTNRGTAFNQDANGNLAQNQEEKKEKRREKRSEGGRAFHQLKIKLDPASSLWVERAQTRESPTTTKKRIVCSLASTLPINPHPLSLSRLSIASFCIKAGGRRELHVSPSPALTHSLFSFPERNLSSLSPSIICTPPSQTSGCKNRKITKK